MEVATAGKVVSITYLIRDETGEVCEYRDLPVAYIHGGRSDLLPKIERALEGKPAGFTTTVSLSPAEGFGEHDAGLTFTDSLDNVPPELRHLGAALDAESEGGEVRHFRVTRIEAGKLTVDANHPYAGKTLVYEIKIVGVREVSAEEIASGEARAELAH